MLNSAVRLREHVQRFAKRRFIKPAPGSSWRCINGHRGCHFKDERAALTHERTIHVPFCDAAKESQGNGSSDERWHVRRDTTLRRADRIDCRLRPSASRFSKREVGVWPSANQAGEREDFVKGYALLTFDRIAVTPDLLVDRFAQSEPFVTEFVYEFRVQFCLGRVDKFDRFEERQWQSRVQRTTNER